MVDNTIQQDNSISHCIVLGRHSNCACRDQRAGKSAFKVVLEVHGWELCRLWNGLRNPEAGVIEFVFKFFFDIVSEDHESPTRALLCPTSDMSEILEASANMADSRRDDFDRWLSRGRKLVLGSTNIF
jgi:hypothetical protein